jgi:hypothetical protein
LNPDPLVLAFGATVLRRYIGHSYARVASSVSGVAPYEVTIRAAQWWWPTERAAAGLL